MKAILLNNVRSMQNVGAIFRNADGAWFDSVFLTGFTPCPPRSDISKTALGAEKSVFWEYYQDPKEIILTLKKKGVIIYCLELSSIAQDFRSIENIPQDICIIVGNEVTWVEKELIELSDRHIFIPMLWKKTSLNVSVAAWVVMYWFID